MRNVIASVLLVAGLAAVTSTQALAGGYGYYDTPSYGYGSSQSYSDSYTPPSYSYHSNSYGYHSYHYAPSYNSYGHSYGYNGY